MYSPGTLVSLTNDSFSLIISNWLDRLHAETLALNSETFNNFYFKKKKKKEARREPLNSEEPLVRIFSIGAHVIIKENIINEPSATNTSD